MLPRTAFSTSVTLSCPAACARSPAARGTCRENSWAAATNSTRKMTTLPVRCRNAKDETAEPISAALSGARGTRRAALLLRLFRGFLRRPWRLLRGLRGVPRPGGSCRRSGHGAGAVRPPAPAGRRDGSGSRCRRAGAAGAAGAGASAGTGTITRPGTRSERTRDRAPVRLTVSRADRRPDRRGAVTCGIDRGIDGGRCRRRRIDRRPVRRRRRGADPHGPFGGARRPGRAAGRRAAWRSAAAGAPLRRAWACRRRTSCPPGPARGARCRGTGSCPGSGPLRQAPARPGPRAPARSSASFCCSSASLVWRAWPSR